MSVSLKDFIKRNSQMNFFDLDNVELGDSGLIDKKSIAFYRQLQPEKILYFIEKYGFKHIVSIAGNDGAYNLKKAVSLANNQKNFLNMADCEIWNMFTGVSGKPFIFSFNSSMDKARLDKEFVVYFGGIPGASRFQSVAMMVLDELFTNAIYNAPVVRMDGNSSVSRKISITMKEDAFIFLECSRKKIHIGCIDPYGTLVPDKLVRKLSAIYSNGADESMRFEENGGAGIGFRMMFDKCTEMFVGVQKMKKTCVFFSLPVNMKEYGGNVPKNIHLQME